MLSADGARACVPCHRLGKAAGTDRRTVPEGAQSVALRRNTPSVYNVALSDWYFWDGRPTGGNQGRVNIVNRRKAAFRVHAIKYFADHMKGREQIGATMADEQAHRLPNLRLQGVVTNQRTNDHVVGVFAQCLFHVKRWQAGGTAGA